MESAAGVETVSRYFIAWPFGMQLFVPEPWDCGDKVGRPRKKGTVFTVSPEPAKVSAVGAAIADDAWERLAKARQPE